MSNGAVTLAHSTLDTPIGRLGLFATELGLVKVTFDSDRLDQLGEQLAARLSACPVDEPDRLDGAKRQLDQYFNRLRRVFDLRLDLGLAQGFTRQVVKTLAVAPYGRTASYGEVAALLGRPGAARAVGRACGANPVPVVVACHRVIRSDGSLGGYAGREHVKRALLALEGVKIQ
ncbi:MAG: methylated-DNA--[protein]-cysteine S-methyltransferase [Bifidobacteriaceae bacterium]|jgi:methylated-DNA-[protein]-cysteine S-methyltransferase|nr:methylated-DNA--[protein]-cysteine S-methyltransferase [Bifidobacteriaceae bacterium]